jgi:hypothetical protein
VIGPSNSLFNEAVSTVNKILTLSGPELIILRVRTSFMTFEVLRAVKISRSSSSTGPHPLRSSETLLATYKSTRHYNPEDQHRQDFIYFSKHSNTKVQKNVEISDYKSRF